MPVSDLRWPRRGLYLLTPDNADTAQLVVDVAAAIGAGVALLQYRNKTATQALRRDQLRALRPLCVRHGVPLIVNDDIDLALEFDADGVHVGEHDADVAAARAALGPDAIVGASCYDDLDRAHRAARDGASYLAFGAFFPSPTKPNARRADLQLLRDSETLGLPRVAIGGITADNARPLLGAGADLLAVVSDVFDAPDIAAAVRRYASLFQD
jgi:thiamine-phosphate pyrophosphorylase